METSEYNLALKIPHGDVAEVSSLVKESGAILDAVERKGLDGHTDTIVLVLTGTIATLRAVARLLEERYKSRMSAEITVDGIAIKGVSERAVSEVLEIVRESRKASGNPDDPGRG